MSKSVTQRRSVAKGKGSKKAEEAAAAIISSVEASSKSTPTPKQDEEETTNVIVTPVAKTPVKRGKAKAAKTTARRTLFPAGSAPSNSAAVLVSPQPNKGTLGDEEDAEFSIVQRKRKSTITARPPAKRRLIFGKLVSIPEPLASVRQVYKIVNKLTGSLGGNGYSGPIYGELTMGSMQKMIDLMMEHTHLNEHSRFIDVGSGIGKPNLHVAQYPGVEFSCGVEMEHTRWSLGMTCLKAILDEAQKQQQQNLPSDELIQGNCMFLHSNILEANTFDPFTHVYMFSIGFPPPLWTRLSEMWNKSGSSASPADPEGTRNCEYLICYHGPKAIIEDYEFEVELLAQTPTSMHGSKEGHMGYIYKRKPKSAAGKSRKSKDSSEKKRASSRRVVTCDPLFQHSFDLVQQGLDPLHEQVSQQLEETLGGGRRTRRSAKQVLTRASGYE